MTNTTLHRPLNNVVLVLSKPYLVLVPVFTTCPHLLEPHQHLFYFPNICFQDTLAGLFSQVFHLVLQSFQERVHIQTDGHRELEAETSSKAQKLLQIRFPIAERAVPDLSHLNSSAARCFKPVASALYRPQY